MPIHLTGEQVYGTREDMPTWAELDVATRRMYVDHADSLTLYFNTKDDSFGGVVSWWGGLRK